MNMEGKSYFICQYLDKYHHDDASKEYYTFCKYKNIRINESDCNMACDQFGYCRTYSNFSAFNCQEL